MFGFGNYSSYSAPSSNKSSFNSADNNRQNYQSRTSTTSKPKTKTYTNVNRHNDTTSTSTIKQSTLNKYKTKTKPKKKTTITYEGGGSDNNNVINEVTKTAPTVAEVSQVTTADAAAEDTEANRLLKIKKRGRSKSILSGSQGVTKMAADYSLGKKSLLGRV